MKRLLIAIILFVAWFLLSGCFNDDENKEEITISNSSSGVNLQMNSYRKGFVENTNDYPIRIRTVWQFRGETTRSVKVLSSEEKIHFDYIDHQLGFYIYTLDGIMVGWVSGN